ncbi:MAG: hypothetical protein EHM79_04115 [Geobacter sp.]|nr:MAG: hypothetical protein EHM79_04115 [Geobacter sp.]
MVKKALTVCKGNTGITGSRGSSVKGILFFLFAIAVCFGYFYFFTDVLRSKEETPGQSDVLTYEVKKPLPERLVQSSATSGEEAVLPPPIPETPSTGNAAKNLTVSPGEVPSEQEIVKPSVAALPTTKPKTLAAGKNVETTKAPATRKMASAKPVPDAAASRKKTANLTPSVPKRPPVSAKAESGSSRFPTAGGQIKSVVNSQKPTALKVAKTSTKPTASQKAKIIEQPGEKKVGEKFTLVVGTYVLKSSMQSDKAKLEKAGLQPSVRSEKKRNEPMNRLLVAEVASYQAAQDKLAAVKKASKDAFFLRENNKYAIYAGSYFADERAVQEQERLRKLGFAPILKKSQAPVSTYSLAAGSYPSRDAALKGASRLEKLGFKPYPVELSK